MCNLTHNVVSVLKFQVKLDPLLHFILLYFPYFGRIRNIFGVGVRRGYCKFTVTTLMEGGGEVCAIVLRDIVVSVLKFQVEYRSCS